MSEADATLILRMEMTIPGDTVEQLFSLKDALSDPSDDRSNYEIEQEIDAILADLIEIMDIADLASWDIA